MAMGVYLTQEAKYYHYSPCRHIKVVLRGSKNPYRMRGNAYLSPLAISFTPPNVGARLEHGNKIKVLPLLLKLQLTLILVNVLFRIPHTLYTQGVSAGERSVPYLQQGELDTLGYD